MRLYLIHREVRQHWKTNKMCVNCEAKINLLLPLLLPLLFRLPLLPLSSLLHLLLLITIILFSLLFISIFRFFSNSLSYNTYYIVLLSTGAYSHTSYAFILGSPHFTLFYRYTYFEISYLFSVHYI